MEILKFLKHFKTLLLTVSLVVVIASAGYCVAEAAKSSPNYLIILIHGNNSKGNIFGHGDADNHGWESNWEDQEPYGDLKFYLGKDLGLEGYVYSYTFSNRRGSNIIDAHELGDKDYYKNNPTAPRYKDMRGEKPIDTDKRMIDYAKEEFINWFRTKGPGRKELNPSCPDGRDPTPSEIPAKYVLIAHSMGGLAARYYITSNFYQNDVAKLIMIDTPNLGADAVTWVRKFSSTENAFRSVYAGAVDNALRTLFQSWIPLMEDLYVSSAHWNMSFIADRLGAAGEKLQENLKKMREKSGMPDSSRQMSLEKAKDFFDLSVKRLETRDPELVTEYVITGVPKKENKFLGKMGFYIDSGKWVPLKILMYDAKGKPMSQNEIQYQEISDVYIPVKNISNVTTPMGVMKVEMEFSNIKVNQGIKDSEFKI